MLYAENPTDELNRMGREVTSYSQRLRTVLKDDLEPLELDLVRNLYREFPEDALYFVADGILQAEHNERPVFFYEPGDLIGTHTLTGGHPPVIQSLEPVTLLRIDTATLKEKITREPEWHEFLAYQNTFFSECCCAGVLAETSPKIGFIRYKENDVIIQEGDSAAEVYELMSGEAAVYVQGEQVGTIKPNELFGAMAALTGTHRTATVIATAPCMAMAVPVQHFMSLLRSQPKTALTLMENMAQQILTLNHQIVDARRSGSAQ